MKTQKKLYGGPQKNLMSKEFDFWLFLCALLLAVFGVIMVYSATRTTHSNMNTIVQSVALALGLGLLFPVCFFDYEQYKNLIRPIFGASIVLLCIVLVFGVAGDWGARSWIRIGSIGIQPAELAKLCFIITFSYHLEKVQTDINKPLVIVGLLIHFAVPVFLILLQPDMGSALVFAFMFICMLFVAKISYKYVISAMLAAVAALPIIYKYILSEYQQKRIQVFLNPEMDPLDRGYNVIQSKIAVGSGELWGKGYLEGTQNQMGYLPTKSTDFIFSVISEELGFVGAIIVVLLLFWLVYRCFATAQRADNAFGRYLCTGVGAMFLFHVFENVGMCIGLMPVTGIPLPFISYGGTSLITNFIAVGMVMSVRYHNKPRRIFDVY